MRMEQREPCRESAANHLQTSHHQSGRAHGFTDSSKRRRIHGRRPPALFHRLHRWRAAHGLSNSCTEEEISLLRDVQRGAPSTGQRSSSASHEREPFKSHVREAFRSHVGKTLQVSRTRGAQLSRGKALQLSQGQRFNSRVLKPLNWCWHRASRRGRPDSCHGRRGRPQA